MSIKQKLGLGAFLTMNIWLITIALVRVTSFKQGMTFDLIWTLFFQFLEPNIAILAACFSAFRSIFVTNGSEARGKRDRPSHSLRKIFRKTPSDHRPLDGLPTVTGATLTGLRTALGNVTNTSNRDSTLNPIGDRSERDFADSSGRIHVKHDWSLDSTRVWAYVKLDKVPWLTADRLHLLRTNCRAGNLCRPTGRLEDGEFEIE